MEGDQERDEMDPMSMSKYGWRERRRLEAPGGRLGRERVRSEGLVPHRLRELIERRSVERSGRRHADGGWVPPPTGPRTGHPAREGAGAVAERMLAEWEGDEP